MTSQKVSAPTSGAVGILTDRRARLVVLTLLCIEFVDELIFGAMGAAWPAIRTDLGLSYAQIGLLFSIPAFICNIIEPPLMVMSDHGRRSTIVAMGGMAFTAGLGLFALADGFWAMLVALTVLYPASGAFVSLAQATLVSLHPERREQMMVRWTVVGSVAVVLGPLLLGALVTLGYTWRAPFVAVAALSFVAAVAVWWINPPQETKGEERPSVLRGMWEAVLVMRRWAVLRWLILLIMADLVLEVFVGFLALYMVDVAGQSEAVGGGAVALWRSAGLVGELGLIWLLTRVEGLKVVRFTAAVAIVLLPIFLLVEGAEAKLVVVALLGLLSAGWYAISMAGLYGSLPDRGGTALAAAGILGLVDGFIPAGVGALAHGAGLDVALHTIVLGPLVMALILWRVSGEEDRG